MIGLDIMTFLELLKIKLERKKDFAAFEDITALFERNEWEKVGISEQEFLDAFLEVYEEYCENLVVTRRGLSMKGVDGAPDWYGYERLIWDASFKYIEPILKIKKFKDENKLVDGVLTLCLNHRYGKGRQSLVILIGKYGANTYASSLAFLLDDPEVSIQVIAALTKMKDLSQYGKVKIIAEEKKATPERLYAKKYIKKMNAYKKNPSEG
ncbi:hypothetical protein KV69_10920 [Listeria monocytogenes]|nr:hypothetical protein [Listeria monocytogenes]